METLLLSIILVFTDGRPEIDAADLVYDVEARVLVVNNAPLFSSGFEDVTR